MSSLESLRITMIGASGSGKTSFMSGLHHHFVNNRSENGGFGITPVGDNNMDNVVNLYSMATVVEEGEFPQGSRGSSHFRFNFSLRGEDICAFDWLDYRGGAIEEALSNEAATPADYQEIRLAIDNSESLAVFIDALQLVQYESDLKARKFSGVSIANKLITTLGLDYKFGKSLTILFVLTKADGEVIDERWRQNNYEAMMRRAEKLLKPALDVATQKRWRCGVVATGVVGVGQVKTRVLSTSSSGQVNFYNIIPDVDPIPFNQESALFYLLGSVLADLTRQKAMEESRIRAEVDQLFAEVQKQGLAGRLAQAVRKKFGGITRDQIIQKKLTEANALRGALLRHEYHINEMFRKSMEKVRVLTPW